MEESDLAISIEQEEHRRQTVRQPEQDSGQNGLIFEVIAGGMQIVRNQERDQIEREVDQELLHPQSGQAVDLDLTETRADREQLLAEGNSEINDEQRNEAEQQALQEHDALTRSGQRDLFFQCALICLENSQRLMAEATSLQLSGSADEGRAFSYLCYKQAC